MCFDPISYDKAEKAIKHSKNVQEQLNQVIDDLAQHKSDYTTLKGVDEGVITHEKLSFAKQGDNKFLGKYEKVRMLTNGVIQASANSRTAIIPIVGGETYYIVKDDSEHFRLGWNIGEPEVGDTVDYYVGNFYGTELIQEAPHDATHMVLVVSYSNEEPRLQVTTRPMPFFVGYDFIPLENIGGFQSYSQDNIDPFWINDIRNGIENGNFERGSYNWYYAGIDQITFDNNSVTFIPTTERNYIQTERGVPRNTGDILYLSAEIKTESHFAGVGIRGVIYGRVEPSNDYKHVSVTVPSPNDLNAPISVTCEGTPQEVSVKNVMGINLTTFFGKGNEPSKEEMDYIVRNYYDGFVPYQEYRPAKLNEVVYNDLIKQTKNLERNNFTDTGITKTKEVYPVLAAVKTVNDRDNEIPRPIGWLYIVPEPPYRMLYASGSPDNMKYLCDWDITKTYDGNRDPSWYRAFITKDGDIIFVYRGDRHFSAGDEKSRQNPIIYPSGDWENPVEIDFGERLKPTAWLQNCGADYLYNQDLFMFSEYTRPSHTTCNVWRVQKPFTDPDNWEIVYTETVTASMKHLHTLNYDPYSQLIYASTGDSSSANQILSSSDFGETWKIEHSGDSKARVLNLIFTKDKVYWANDDGGNHGLYSVDRDSSGVPDFSNITELYKFVSVPPSYATILIDEPYGLLILNRFDGGTEGPLPIHFWDIDTQSMHVIKEIDYVGETPPGGGWGFRLEAVNWYQARGDDRIVTGFSNPPNDMDLLGNTKGDNIERINNLVLQVSKKDGEYELDISALQDRG